MPMLARIRDFSVIAAVLASSAYANTITAASCSSSNVQSAINSAYTGDTVLVPGGSCTWSTTVSIPSSKAITVSGGGKTSIAGTLDLKAGTSGNSRITGFTFTSNSAVTAEGSKSTTAFRIDHNTFSQPNNQAIFVICSGNAPGLIDHNQFTGGSASEMIHNMGAGPSDGSGWTDDVVPGSPNMLFIEDNTFTYNATGSPAYFWGTSALQSYYGARTVFRHNTCNMCQVDQHGTAGMIGARWWEIYENTFNVVTNGNQSDYIAIRAGSGVIFNNHVTGAANQGAGTIELYEEDSGYPALYQVGRGINQNYSPAYIWGNDASMHVTSGSSNVVQGRDFMTSSSQPSGMKRWELGSDSSSTTYSYTPYTYPHPLQNQSDTTPTAPSAPTSLTTKVQ
jgi:hypothetical protein